MKIDCPECAGLGRLFIAAFGMQKCSYCNGLGSVALHVQSRGEKIHCHICGKRIYNQPYQFLLKGVEEEVFYCHRIMNEDGLECKALLDKAKAQKNFRLLPDGPLKEAFYESKKKGNKQHSAFIPH